MCGGERVGECAESEMPESNTMLYTEVQGCSNIIIFFIVPMQATAMGNVKISRHTCIHSEHCFISKLTLRRNIS